MRKIFIIDTNVLLDDANAITQLRNGDDDNIIIVPYSVIVEMDRVKENVNKSHLVSLAMNKIMEDDKVVIIRREDFKYNKENCHDDTILDDIKYFLSSISEENEIVKMCFFVSNDKIFRLRAKVELGIETQEYKSSNPFKSDAEIYTGYVRPDSEIVKNCFVLNDNKIWWDKTGDFIDELTAWKLRPRNVYQNMAMHLLLDDDLKVVSMQSGAGYGKSQPFSAKVYTPNGYKKMGDIRVGDVVFDMYGNKQIVLGIFDQGRRKLYQTEFSDGSHTRCTPEHLWTISNTDDKFSTETSRTVELQEIAYKDFVHGELKIGAHEYDIPVCPCVDYENNENQVLFDPYIMGIILGDKGFDPYECRLSGTLPEAVMNELLSKLPGDMILDESKIKYLGSKGISPLKIALGEWNLYVPLEERRIPSDLLRSSLSIRRKLISGLMDSNSSLKISTFNDSDRYPLAFKASSYEFADEFLTLIHSVGGIGKIDDKSYIVSFKLNEDVIPQSLLHKFEYVSTPPRRTIKKIIPLREEEECRCIYVSGRSHTYLTDNMIVTHNTTLTLAAALQIVFQKPKTTIPEEYKDLIEQSDQQAEATTSKRGRKKTTSENLQPSKLYKKIFIVRPTTILGEELGFLPGDLGEKLDPYFRPVRDLLIKLHEIRPCNRLFNDGKPENGFDPHVIEFIPITFLRGMNIDNAIVIIDECQNLSRQEIRTTLSRMGENVRCFLTGDTNQIDNKYLNESNNGLNWVLRKFKGQPEYGHITLKGSKSRGPITDLVLKTKL